MYNITFNQAKKLSKLGFDEECRHHYVEYIDGSFCMVDGKVSDHEKDFNIYPAPYVYQVVEWLKDKHKILIGSIPVYPSISPKYNLVVTTWIEDRGKFECELNVKAYNTMDAAFMVGIDYAFMNIKTKE